MTPPVQQVCGNGKAPTGKPARLTGSCIRPLLAQSRTWRLSASPGQTLRELKLWQGQPNRLVVANNIDTLGPNGPAHILGMDEGCCLWQANAVLRADDFDLPIVRLPDVDAGGEAYHHRYPRLGALDDEEVGAFEEAGAQFGAADIEQVAA